jgi:dihydrofolate reductase
MPNVIYSMSVSLDGFIAGPDDELDWSVPDEELHQFHNDQVRELGAHLLGRRLYETMTYWESAEQQPSFGPVEREFAGLWQELPKIVFSTTLESVVGNTTLLRGGVVEEVEKLKRQPGKDIGVGGAGLAAALIAENLVDEYRLFFNPVVLGAGTPYLPALDRRIDLQLAERREFGSRVVYLRYTRA